MSSCLLFKRLTAQEEAQDSHLHTVFGDMTDRSAWAHTQTDSHVAENAITAARQDQDERSVILGHHKHSLIQQVSGNGLAGLNTVFSIS